MGTRILIISLVFIAGLAFCGCQDRGKDKKTGMDIVEKPWPVWAVAFSPDGRSLAAGRGYRSEAGYWMGGKGDVNIWEVEHWKLREGFSVPFTTYVQALAFTPDSKHLVAAATQYIQKAPEGWGPFAGGPNPHDGNVVFVWTVPVGSLEQTHHFNDFQDSHKRGAGFVASLDIHPGGDLIGMYLAGNASIVLQRKTGDFVYKVVGDNGVCQNLAFSPDGKTLASLLRSSVQLYDAGTGKELARFKPKFENPAHFREGEHGPEQMGDWPICIRFSPDGKQIAVGVSDGSVRLLAADLSKQLRSLQVSTDKEKVQALAFAAKADLLAVATTTMVRLFEASSGKQLREWGKDELRVSSVALSPEGTLLAVGHGGKHDVKGEFRGGYVNIWDTATGQLVRKLD